MSGFTSLPSAATRKMSGGAVSVDFEKTANPDPGRAEEIDPPCNTRAGTPPDAGTVNRSSRPCCDAVNHIDMPSGESA